MRHLFHLLPCSFVFVGLGCSLVSDFGDYEFKGLGDSGVSAGAGGASSADAAAAEDGSLPAPDRDAAMDGPMPTAGSDGPVPQRCGNGVEEQGEQCDDGNDVSGDGCEPDCSFTCEEASDCDDGQPCNGAESCGEDHLCHPGDALTGEEECTLDSGGTGKCVSGLCVPPNCGDNVIDDDEECDDGNDTVGDGCEPDCTFTCQEDGDCDDDDVCNGQELCTAMHVCVPGESPGEVDCTLDDGSTGSCQSGLCVPASCGDGVVDVNEDCDDAGESAACNVDCTAAGCGDGKRNLTAGEHCDDGEPTAKCDDACLCRSGYQFTEDQCQCDANFFDTGSSCIDELQAPCDEDNGNPANSHDVIANTAITYTDADGWSEPARCDWACDADYDKRGDQCLNERSVQCDDANGNPDNSDDIIDQVVITYTNAGGWTAPAACAWECNADYDLTGDECLNERTVQCDEDNGKPDNSTDIIDTVLITYTDAGGWTPAAACAWECNADYDLIGDECLNERTVQCDEDNGSPDNSTDIIDTVLITYTEADGWTPAAACAWECDANYDLIGDECLNERFVRCDENNGNPANSSDIIEDVLITYTEADGWTPAAACAWNCNENYTVNGAGTACIVIDCDAHHRLGNTSNGMNDVYDSDTGDSKAVYCAMDIGRIGIEMGVGHVEGGYAQWQIISVEQWQNPIVQDAFIAYYNTMGGIPNIDIGFTISNCRFCLDVATQLLFSNADHITTYTTAGDFYCVAEQNEPFLNFGLDLVWQGPPLPANYFEINPPISAADIFCGSTPAFHMRTSSPLPAVLFYDGFGDGTLNKWVVDGTGFGISSDTPPGGKTYSAQQAGSDNNHGVGMHVSWSSGISPSYISFWFMTNSTASHGPYVTSNVDDGTLNQHPFFIYIENSGDLVNSASGIADVPAVPDRWYHIELRNIDWASYQYDYYLDGVFQGVAGFRFDSSVMRRLSLYNYTGGNTVRFDEVLILE